MVVLSQTHRLMAGLCAVILSGGLLGCGPSADRETVTVYTSQDQVYAEPLLRRFTETTGIEALAVFDSEAVKTVGLAGRLIAEQNHPQCDLFWSNEALQTRVLAARGVLEEETLLSFGYRSRRMVVNTNLLALANAPLDLESLTNAAWKGKVVLAYPLFGTTFLHFAALREHWGDAKWESWCRALVANEAMVVDGNSVVVRQVSRGEAPIGLTDSDDIAAGQREGGPIIPLPLNEDLPLIPNTIGFVRNAPRPEAARGLAEYLVSPLTVERLVQVGALEGASADEVQVQTLQPEWETMVRRLDDTAEVLRTIFLR